MISTPDFSEDEAVFIRFHQCICPDGFGITHVQKKGKQSQGNSDPEF